MLQLSDFKELCLAEYSKGNWLIYKHFQECPTEPILKIAAPQAKLCWLANLRLRQNPGWDGISSRKFAGNFVKYRSVAGKICFLLAGRRKKQTTTQINTQRYKKHLIIRSGNSFVFCCHDCKMYLKLKQTPYTVLYVI